MSKTKSHCILHLPTSKITIMKPPSLSRLVNRFSSSRRHDDNLNYDQDDDQISLEDDILIPNTNPNTKLHRLHNPMSNMTLSHAEHLNNEAQDYIFSHGGLLKSVMQIDDRMSPAARGQNVGISLRPSPFPRRLFEEACALQTSFQELYVAIARDPEWLGGVLGDVIRTDPLVGVLWKVYEVSWRRRREGERQGKISAGIFRSDYMLHVETGGQLSLKQVEFNTIACAGSLHGQRVTNLHRYLYKRGAYNNLLADAESELSGCKLEIPEADNQREISDVLEAAHRAYVQRFRRGLSGVSLETCILMVVQPRNFNIVDERPIEYELWSREPTCPCFRIEWGEELLESVDLSPDGQLYFHSPNHVNPYEVSVVYLRAGFEPFEYEEDVGFEIRLMLEVSNAVVCPDILAHLVGSKKVQQALCIPGSVERFVDAEKAEALRRTFMEIHPLDETDEGIHGRLLASDPRTASDYVLKPSRDGGGHNVYREDIGSFLAQLPTDRWAEYVLMKMIEPIVANNALISFRGAWLGDVVAELGIWGGCIWEQSESNPSVFVNKRCGWSVRSKNPSVNEMSVVKGYGCFDTVTLVDVEVVAGLP